MEAGSRVSVKNIDILINRLYNIIRIRSIRNILEGVQDVGVVCSAYFYFRFVFDFFFIIIIIILHATMTELFRFRLNKSIDYVYFIKQTVCARIYDHGNDANIRFRIIIKLTQRHKHIT